MLHHGHTQDFDCFDNMAFILPRSLPSNRIHGRAPAYLHKLYMYRPANCGRSHMKSRLPLKTTWNALPRCINQECRIGLLKDFAKHTCSNLHSLSIAKRFISTLSQTWNCMPTLKIIMYSAANAHADTSAILTWFKQYLLSNWSSTKNVMVASLG